MFDVRVSRRLVPYCPCCGSIRHEVLRRVPAATHGHVLNRCYCRSCRSYFLFEEDREGRLVGKDHGPRAPDLRPEPEV